MELAAPWIAFLVHLVVAVVAWRRMAPSAVLPLTNLVTAALVVAYWVVRWYSYLFQGVSWSGTDQLLPLYALVVCVLAVMSLLGRGPLAAQWVFLTIDGVALLGVALVFVALKNGRMF